ncbi:MAG: DegT/DnrJ/EryC1/StrS aminotransferase family protein [Pseudomonadota bacterium]
MDLIPHSKPTLGNKEIKVVSEVIASGHIAQGQTVSLFEQSVAQEIGVKGAVACSSGTAALHLTLLAMDIGAGDEVIFPSYVCSALLNAVQYVKATPVLAEADPRTHNIDPVDVKKRLSSTTKAIVVPHLFGLPADLTELTSFGIPVIEDCAQAVGAGYKGRKVGAFGHAAILSFYATKVMTTGEGGMVVSNSRDLLDRVKDLREYDQKKSPAVRYNYKMTDIQAAMGLSQLEQLPDFISRRRKIARDYYSAFEKLPVDLPLKGEGHIYYRYIIGMREDVKPKIGSLRGKGIMCAMPVYMPIHRYLKQRGYPVTEKIWRRSLSIPIYPSLKDEEVSRVAHEVSDLLGN